MSSSPSASGARTVSLTPLRVRASCGWLVPRPVAAKLRGAADVLRTEAGTLGVATKAANRHKVTVMTDGGHPATVVKRDSVRPERPSHVAAGPWRTRVPLPPREPPPVQCEGHARPHLRLRSGILSNVQVAARGASCTRRREQRAADSFLLAPGHLLTVRCKLGRSLSLLASALPPFGYVWRRARPRPVLAGRPPPLLSEWLCMLLLFAAYRPCACWVAGCAWCAGAHVSFVSACCTAALYGWMLSVSLDLKKNVN